MKRFSLTLTAAAVALIALSLTAQTRKHQYGPRDKAFYASPEVVDFLRPGLAVAINSASVASNGAINVTYTVTDPDGLPLDAAGVTTPGPISLAFVASFIPKGQEQYVAYTTAQATGAALGTITRPDFELGGKSTQVGAGQYQYVFLAHAPAGFDATVTNTVAIAGNRDLTAFNMGTNYAGATFNFVPNGAAVSVTRDVIRNQSCNTCHDQLAFHGGYAQAIQMCVLCHQPQNLDPVTGNSLDLKVMAHKIHMGSQLPSVVGTATKPGVPYQIAGYMNFLTNFSTVIDPADPRRCGTCHSLTTGAAQAKAFLLEPTRAACGACHDDVNFSTGVNHPGGPQHDDTLCSDCHIPLGELPFDASILGSHVVPNDTPASYPVNPNPLISSVQVSITGVTNTSAGQKPVVAYTVKDINGKPLALSSLEDLQFTMAGPTTDYGYTSFGSDVTTPGYVGEDGTPGSCSANGSCTYTFLHAIPAKATGTYAIGVESERLENILAGTSTAQQVESGTPNQEVYFSVDGSAVQPRRTVVAETNCNQCHVHLTVHGNRRNDPQYCVLCHNPSNTDASQRPAGQTAQTINMAVMVHRIHDGVNVLPAGGQPYVVIGNGGSTHNFSAILYPAMDPAGSAPYLQNCAICHVNGSEQVLPTGLNPVIDPQGWINPVQPVASSCSGCHVSKPEASHFLSNTGSLGETCTLCHSAGAPFAVDAVHTP